MTLPHKYIAAAIIGLFMLLCLAGMWLFLTFASNTRYYETTYGSALGELDALTGKAWYRHLEIGSPYAPVAVDSGLEVRLRNGDVLRIAEDAMDRVRALATSDGPIGNNDDGWPLSATSIRVGGCRFIVLDGKLAGIVINALSGDDGAELAIRRVGDTSWMPFPISQRNVEKLLGSQGIMVDSWHP